METSCAERHSEGALLEEGFEDRMGDDDDDDDDDAAVDVRVIHPCHRPMHRKPHPDTTMPTNPIRF